MAETGEPRLPKTIRTYEVQRLLGKGGMGEVYLAKHADLDRPVAIKRFAPPPGTKDLAAARERFQREGKALAKLRHQGVIGVHDLFEHRGEHYMVLEYVDGVVVSDLLERGPLPMEIACLIGLGLAEALEHAHFHGIIHRDVKTANVMVSRDGQVKLMDFGIARGELLERVTQTGVLVGTPQYVAPEALMSKEQTVLGDIYGIGSVLYHCLSGKRLYFHVSQKDLYQAILAGRFVSLTKVAGRMPRSLRTIVHRCLARDPAKRYQSASAFRAELDLFLADQGVWGSRAERLAVFLRSVDALPAGQTLDSIEIVVADPISRRPLLRPVLWAIIALLLLGLGAFGFWGALRLGWLDPVLAALR
jgi:serine/threonine-protein kinase